MAKAKKQIRSEVGDAWNQTHPERHRETQTNGNGIFYRGYSLPRHRVYGAALRPLTLMLCVMITLSKKNCAMFL